MTYKALSHFEVRMSVHNVKAGVAEVWFRPTTVAQIKRQHFTFLLVTNE